MTLREKKLAAFVSELELRQKELKQDDERNGVYLEDIRESLLKKSKEVERLQTHLMEVETAHGHEILDLESTISVLKTELAESSRGQNTWKELMSTERELCAQALEAKEVAEEELSTLQKINQELSTKNKELTQSMQNLQSVLQNFEKCMLPYLCHTMNNAYIYWTAKESDVELALRAMEKDTVLFKTQAENAEKRAYDSEAQVRQLTIDRSLLTEQTETIGRLRHDVARLQNHLSEAMKRLKDGSDTDGVDRHLITNFLVQFLSLPQGDSRKFEILKIIGGILRLNDEDQVRIGLKRRTESPGEAVKKEDASFMDLWISFLHREAGLEGSEPRSSS